MDSSIEANAGTLDVISDAICPWCWIGKRNLDAALGIREQQSLRIGIGYYEINAHKAAADHVIDRVATGATDANN